MALSDSLSRSRLNSSEGIFFHIFPSIYRLLQVSRYSSFPHRSPPTTGCWRSPCTTTAFFVPMPISQVSLCFTSRFFIYALYRFLHRFLFLFQHLFRFLFMYLCSYLFWFLYRFGLCFNMDFCISIDFLKLFWPWL